ncbi:hypothetical protein PISMIDRAFT_9583 [Pisolithus microcarpus 441]|uniref:DUF6589 domain-containing protein n=1 Tax=Pisolithus microcarpus 441 TaxID=765257 RepID=A0A0C9YKU0_9AGAM|nr:hypothetical protein BKA83DRAFT_9583 [Pisolithus microcarpus]KIK25590.1 hypothetical protein PISMIDRAFT_9583 [Pisolithus microcarpus 441]
MSHHMLPLHVIFEALNQCQISVAGLIVALLTSEQYENHYYVADLLAHSREILDAFSQHPASQHQFALHLFRITENAYLQELRHLTSEDSGWHFKASNTSTKQLEDFNLKKMAWDMEDSAPQWWSLLGVLLGDKGKSESEGQKDEEGGAPVAPEEDGNVDSYWDDVDEIDLEGLINELTGEQGPHPPIENRYTRCHAGIKMTKKTIVMSILMHGSNQKANALQSLLGLFLQSTHTPYKVIDTLAHLGISISTDTINAAVKALSSESQNSLQHLGQSLLASYAYNNFNVDLKSYVPTMEKSNDSLKHLTSGLLFPLVHGVTSDDLKCSRELWEKSVLNLQADDLHTPHKYAWWDLLKLLLHPESPGLDSKLSCQDRFNSWMFLHDLCTYGPDYFCQFKLSIPKPECIEQIPLVKMPIFAAQAMDVNNSTVSGNIQAVTDLLAQGGLADPANMSFLYMATSAPENNSRQLSCAARLNQLPGIDFSTSYLYQDYSI